MRHEVTVAHAIHGGIVLARVTRVGGQSVDWPGLNLNLYFHNVVMVPFNSARPCPAFWRRISVAMLGESRPAGSFSMLHRGWEKWDFPWDRMGKNGTEWENVRTAQAAEDG